MGLEIKQAFLKQDKSGRSIDIKDATGLESNGVVTGTSFTRGTIAGDTGYSTWV